MLNSTYASWNAVVLDSWWKFLMMRAVRISLGSLNRRAAVNVAEALRADTAAHTTGCKDCKVCKSRQLEDS